ncbi:c-type heme family protein [Gloeothece verrucosa]|uniref:histidine kinase n=1 Tax=Gloeothece verrucosa (strain PCC 7822) TaxID=497965 RepID=E0UB01_GLOV7|nr:DUF3365 domain-containing protein [Gloeothece verrucosa]ADN15123.1 putative sensor with HAMP domain [Gloeothece verrucosa PCC 7822]
MFEIFRSRLREVNLSKQISILLGLLFVGAILLSGFLIGIILNQSAQRQVTAEASALLKTMNAVSAYTDKEITPELSARLNNEFLPQIIPFFAAWEVFEKLRDNPQWQNYFYKDATLNPTNLRDRADDFETDIIKQMSNNRQIQQLSGFRSREDEQMFYIAQPIVVSSASCLECHSTPEVAPKSMIERYGSSNGFNWQLNKVIGANMIYVPASQVFNIARRNLLIFLAIMLTILGVTLFVVNYWLTRSVVRPLKRMTKVAEAISSGNLDADFQQKSLDEVGLLAQAFTRIKATLVLAMQRLERYGQ